MLDPGFSSRGRPLHRPLRGKAPALEIVGGGAKRQGHVETRLDQTVHCLEHFRIRHPEIEICIDGTDRLVDLARDDADVALRYCPGGYNRV